MTADKRISTDYPARDRAAVGCSATALHTDNDRLSWTQLGIRMGFTRDDSQRLEIFEGIARMVWTEAGKRHGYLGGHAARSIARAILGPHPEQPYRVGIARLDARRQLIGVEHGPGTRSFVLDLDVEALHVLDDFNQRQPRIA